MSSIPAASVHRAVQGLYDPCRDPTFPAPHELLRMFNIQHTDSIVPPPSAGLLETRGSPAIRGHGTTNPTPPRFTGVTVAAISGAVFPKDNSSSSAEDPPPSSLTGAADTPNSSLPPHLPSGSPLTSPTPQTILDLQQALADANRAALAGMAREARMEERIEEMQAHMRVLSLSGTMPHVPPTAPSPLNAQSTPQDIPAFRRLVANPPAAETVGEEPSADLSMSMEPPPLDETWGPHRPPTARPQVVNSTTTPSQRFTLGPDPPPPAPLHWRDFHPSPHQPRQEPQTFADVEVRPPTMRAPLDPATLPANSRMPDPRVRSRNPIPERFMTVHAADWTPSEVQPPGHHALPPSRDRPAISHYTPTLTSDHPPSTHRDNILFKFAQSMPGPQQEPPILSSIQSATVIAKWGFDARTYFDAGLFDLDEGQILSVSWRRMLTRELRTLITAPWGSYRGLPFLSLEDMTEYLLTRCPQPLSWEVCIKHMGDIPPTPLKANAQDALIHLQALANAVMYGPREPPGSTSQYARVQFSGELSRIVHIDARGLIMNMIMGASRNPDDLPLPVEMLEIARSVYNRMVLPQPRSDLTLGSTGPPPPPRHAAPPRPGPPRPPGSCRYRGPSI